MNWLLFFLLGKVAKTEELTTKVVENLPKVTQAEISPEEDAARRAKVNAVIDELRVVLTKNGVSHYSIGIGITHPDELTDTGVVMGGGKDGIQHLISTQVSQFIERSADYAAKNQG